MSSAATRASVDPISGASAAVELDVHRAELVAGVVQPLVQPLDPPVHHLDLAAQHVDLPADAVTLSAWPSVSGRNPPPRGPALDRRHLLVQLRGALGEFGDGLVQAAEPARRRLHALLQHAHAVLQPGHPLVLRPQGLEGLAGGVAYRLQPRQGLLHVLRHGAHGCAHFRPQRMQLGQRRHLRAERLDVLGQRLGPGRRPLHGLFEVTGQPVEPGGQARDLPFANLLDQPLEPLQPLADVLQRARVRPLVRDVVLDGPREQFAHAVGGAAGVSAKQDVVARLIHDAPSEGGACPDVGFGQSGRHQDPTTLVATCNQLCSESENIWSARQGLGRPVFDESVRRHYCSGLALTSVEC